MSSRQLIVDSGRDDQPYNPGHVEPKAFRYRPRVERLADNGHLAGPADHIGNEPNSVERAISAIRVK